MIWIFALLAIQVQQLVPAAGCETVGTELFCPPPEASDPFFGAAHQTAFRRRVDAARKALAEKESGPVTLRKRVGALIANHDCDGAYKLALTEGDLELAAQARQLCSASSASPD